MGQLRSVVVGGKRQNLRPTRGRLSNFWRSATTCSSLTSLHLDIILTMPDASAKKRKYNEDHGSEKKKKKKVAAAPPAPRVVKVSSVLKPQVSPPVIGMSCLPTLSIPRSKSPDSHRSRNFCRRRCRLQLLCPTAGKTSATPFKRPPLAFLQS